MTRSIAGGVRLDGALVLATVCLCSVAPAAAATPARRGRSRISRDPRRRVYDGVGPGVARPERGDASGH